jgi:hypothetical protein
MGAARIDGFVQSADPVFSSRVPWAVAAIFARRQSALKRTMLSVVLLAFDSRPPPPADGERLVRERIVRSLSSLIEGCVQGLFADAALAGPAGAGLDRIADEAGCQLVEAIEPREALAKALALTRCADVFLLRAGYAVERSFIEEARDVLAFDALAAGGSAVLRAAPTTLLTRLAPGLAEPVGLLARKETLAGAGLGELPGLARRLRGADLATRARRAR